MSKKENVWQYISLSRLAGLFSTHHGITYTVHIPDVKDANVTHKETFEVKYICVIFFSINQ